MPSINLDLDYFTHPKIVRLAGRLGRGAEVLPIRLWVYCGKYHAADGRLTGYSATDVESVCGWWGKSGEAIDAMVGVGLLEKISENDYRVHDWEEHAGHIVVYQERAKKARAARLDKARGSPSQHDVDLKPTASGREAATGQGNAGQDMAKKNSSLRGLSPARVSAQTTHELEAKDFILRPDESEFQLFLTSVKQLIHTENRARRNNPFTWQPQTGSLDSDMKSLCYKVKDNDKLRVLTEALNVLHHKWNWIDYVLIAIKATIRATLKERIDNHYGFTVHKLKHPHELISAASDGNLSKPIHELLKQAGVRAP